MSSGSIYRVGRPNFILTQAGLWLSLSTSRFPYRSTGLAWNCYDPLQVSGLHICAPSGLRAVATWLERRAVYAILPCRWRYVAVSEPLLAGDITPRSDSRARHSPAFGTSTSRTSARFPIDHGNQLNRRVACERASLQRPVRLPDRRTLTNSTPAAFSDDAQVITGHTTLHLRG